ncbi:hypothetical protein EYF80_047438 [Liparis tanakae]|uniref:Uncharacterized protein n=1 Tax=Liparis tanakae TaxID=230148 RepID=A0A4Z2FMN3_9TELE|nr:hypothetical protein EYF80_047438 [Liparis tanakae]
MQGRLPFLGSWPCSTQDPIRARPATGPVKRSDFGPRKMLTREAVQRDPSPDREDRHGGNGKILRKPELNE